MRIAGYEVHDGIVVIAAFLTVVTLLLLYTWSKTAAVAENQKKLAHEKGWTWADVSPEPLDQALKRLKRYRPNWKASQVIIVPSAEGNSYLFRINRAHISGSGSSTIGQIDALACLIPGTTQSTTPIFTISRRPPKIIETAVGLSKNLIKEMGSTKFQKNFMLILEGLEYDEQPNFDSSEGDHSEIERLISQVKISPKLEAELTRWFRPLGQTQVWSDIYMRDNLVMVIKSNMNAELSPSEWEQLLQMCQGLSRSGY